MSYATVIRPEPYWLVTAALVVGDQLTKLVVARLNMPINLPGISIGSVTNTGGVFGVDVPNGTLIAIGALIAFGLLALLMTRAERPPTRLGLWLLLGGAVSNVIDRVLHGGVVDIVAIAGLSRFNLADVMIILGAVSLLRSAWWKDNAPSSR